MHRLGLRLTAAEYDVLFDENDEDGSGEIDLVRICSARGRKSVRSSDSFGLWRV